MIPGIGAYAAAQEAQPMSFLMVEFITALNPVQQAEVIAANGGVLRPLPLLLQTPVRAKYFFVINQGQK